MRSELLIGVVLAATVAAIAVGAPETSGTALAEEAATAVESPASLLARIEALEEEVRILRAERDLLKRENTRLVKAEKDRLAGADAPAEAAPEKPVPAPAAAPLPTPMPPKPGTGKTYFVPDLDPAWWNDLAAFARDVRRRLILGEGDLDQALPAWLARVGGLAGTEVKWAVEPRDFSIRSILPEHCLRFAEELAKPAGGHPFVKIEISAEEANFRTALQAAWAKAAKSHGARHVRIQAGPCAVSMLLPVDALLDGGTKPRGDFKIVGRIVAVRGRQGGLEVFVDGTVSISARAK